jgi:glyoxylase-like metal-dependent hydrolase (beta-lactamase superfamily II)
MWEEIGQDVFRRRYDALAQNIGAVVAEAGVLVIDSRANPSQARELRSDLGRLTRLPVRWVVNTHYHWDHSFGNSEFSEAELWGHRACRRALVERGGEMLSRLRDQLPPQQKEEFENVTIVPPDHVIGHRHHLNLGSRSVEIQYLGRGHTDSDLVIHVGDVTFAGDLVEEGGPPGFDDSYPAAWVGTLDRLLAEARPVVVPGHGGLVDRKLVITIRDEIAWIIARAHGGDLAVSPYPEAITRKVIERWQSELRSG